MPELISLVLSLQPLRIPQEAASLPRWWGRAAHALLLEVAGAQDPDLAAALHEPGAPGSGSLIRPFTASTLIGRFPLQREQTYTLRFTGFCAQVSRALWEAAQTGGRLAPGAEIELDYTRFGVAAADWGESLPGEESQKATPWAANDTYQSLGAPFLLAAQTPARRLAFQFTSPTTFKSGGKHQPLPLPELVFGSLLERWNACAPVTLPPEVRRYAAECLAVSQYDLETRPVPQKDGGLRVGAVGRITYTAVNYDRYWMSALSALAAFALYGGVGAGAAQGLGQCRAVEAARRSA